MKLFGRRDDIMRQLAQRHPELRAVLDAVRHDIPKSKREVEEHQAAALYALAKRCNVRGASILEIGTALGYSAAVMARAAPLACLVTLNPKDGEWQRARESLRAPAYANATVVPARSWNLLASYVGPPLDLVFVDGDHGQVARDFGWWEWLKAGGLMLFHDYTPDGARRACQPVYEAVDALAAGLGRGFDVLVVDDDGLGMAGFRRREGEPLPALDAGALAWHLDEGTGRWVKGMEVGSRD